MSVPAVAMVFPTLALLWLTFWNSCEVYERARRVGVPFREFPAIAAMVAIVTILDLVAIAADIAGIL